MNAIQHLPPEYQLKWKIDLAKDVKLLLILNLVGLVLFGLALLAFTWLLVNFPRPERMHMESFDPGSLLATLLGVLGTYLLMLALHEGFHGLFFYLFTRARPKFALKWSYAYAAAPTWFIPRRQYWIVAIAPLVGVSLLGIALIPLVTPAWVLPWLVGLAGNAAGAVGDMYVALKLALAPQDTLVNDRGDAIAFYHRSTE